VRSERAEYQCGYAKSKSDEAEAEENHWKSAAHCFSLMLNVVAYTFIEISSKDLKPPV